MDLAKMKGEYQSMEKWNPNKKKLGKYESGWSEDKVNDITQSLLDKTRRAQQRF